MKMNLNSSRVEYEWKCSYLNSSFETETTKTIMISFWSLPCPYCTMLTYLNPSLNNNRICIAPICEPIWVIHFITISLPAFLYYPLSFPPFVIVDNIFSNGHQTITTTTTITVTMAMNLKLLLLFARKQILRAKFRSDAAD